MSSRLIKDISPSLRIKQNAHSSLYANWIHSSGSMHLYIHRTVLANLTDSGDFVGCLRCCVFQDITGKLPSIRSWEGFHVTALVLGLCFLFLPQGRRCTPVPSDPRSDSCSSRPFFVKEAKPFTHIKAIHSPWGGASSGTCESS